MKEGAFVAKPMTIKASTKYKIQDADEMAMFLHLKRKGASITKNGRAYQRRAKHQGRVVHD